MKKYYVLCALSAAVACNQAETKQATITGDIAGLSDSLIQIVTPVADSVKIDTVKVSNGHFTWTGNINGAEKIYIATSQRYIDLYMGNENVTVKGHIDSATFDIKGSATQAEADALTASLKAISDQEDVLYPRFSEVRDNDSARAILEKELEALRLQRRAKEKEYIRSHPESALSVGLLSDMAAMGEYAPLDSLYKSLSEPARNSAAGKRVEKRLTVLKRSALGQPMLDFTQNDVNGKPVKLSDFKGKYVLLDFWASWCGPCRAENPNVLKAYNKFKDKNFIVVGVSLDDDGDKWKAAIQQDGMPWIQLSDLKGWKNEVAQQYGIMGIPYSFLIDPNGVIIAKSLRGAELHEKLASVLNDQKPAI